MGFADDGFPSAANGGQKTTPDKYAPPLVSNGGLCLLVDHQGGLRT